MVPVLLGGLTYLLPHLQILDIERGIARQAAQLRAEYRIRPADALQVAACLSAGRQAFITNDHRLARLQPVIAVIVLDDFISGSDG